MVLYIMWNLFNGATMSYVSNALCESLMDTPSLLAAPREKALRSLPLRMVLLRNMNGNGRGNGERNEGFCSLILSENQLRLQSHSRLRRLEVNRSSTSFVTV